jgi:fused signal recognition particle receptor
MEPWLVALIVLVALVAMAAVFVAGNRRSRPAVPAPRGLKGRLRPAGLAAAMRSAFRGGGDIDWQSMEDAMVAADVGVSAAAGIVSRIRRRHPDTPEQADEMLKEELLTAFENRQRGLVLEGSPAVVLVVGVNGSGKTTTIAKLCHRLETEGHRPMLAAADTFRAAAGRQLETWAERLQVPIVGGGDGADPAAVAFDALQAARARGRDVLLVDTAGRLQVKRDLMDELTKIRRVLEKDAVISEVLLVLDATGGQNGISQVSEFAKAVGVTGIVLAKLDGTAKGGIVVAVEEMLGVPVKLVGVGEGLDDLLPFSPSEFVEVLLA